jgi:NAD+ synthase
MTTPTTSAADLLRLDAAVEIDRICETMRNQVARVLRRRGVVLGLSGGIDSSVCAALAVRALGANRVIGLFMPEEDSSPDSLELGKRIADWLGIRSFVENITPVLQGAGCYARRDDAIRTVIPEYGPGYKSKIVLPAAQGGYNIFSVVVESPQGVQRRERLTPGAYLTIVAATNFKQRVRKMMEYHYADRFNYAVIGTPNRLEYDQGFFVKNGDGSADLKPIAHLYKTQVYQLAESLDVPADIRKRPPTTDTYSLAQSQEEFYFAVPYHQLDICLFGLNHDMSAAEVAPLANLTTEQVDFVYKDIRSKRSTTGYLHEPPLLVEKVLSDE